MTRSPMTRGSRVAHSAARALVLLSAVLAVAAASVEQVPRPQNPSPMSDTTRPHPRVAERAASGQRAKVGQATLFLREGLRPRARLPLVVHFHGAAWLLEHHAAEARLDAGLVTFQLGSGSAAYGTPFVNPAHFSALLDEAAEAAGRLLGQPTSWDAVVLSSFSAGYGAVRAILRVPAHYARVSAVVLADSLHAGYVDPPAGPRSEDLALDVRDLDVFLNLADDAVAGRRRFLVTHSEVFPGTYASTTETADALLRAADVTRRARLAEGPLGMQQLSDSRRGAFRVLGFAGNSAPDHLDHLYALGTWWRDVLTR